MNLKKFSPAPTLSAVELVAKLMRLQASHYVLGPDGTNMVQACKAWTQENKLSERTKIVLCSTPEDSLVQARLTKIDGVVPLFWTCAVFYALNQIFFRNPDIYPFLFSFNYKLDNMQLCVMSRLSEKEWCNEWKIGSHQSPAPLVASLSNLVVDATSNSEAARLCADGKFEACITTAQAAKIYGLAMVHEFGSPIMVFFIGTTQHGLETLLKC